MFDFMKRRFSCLKDFFNDYEIDEISQISCKIMEKYNDGCDENKVEYVEVMEKYNGFYRFIYSEKGNKNSVVLSEACKRRLRYSKLKSIVMVHNHPSNWPPSWDDYDVLMSYKSIFDFIVFGVDKNIYLIRTTKYTYDDNEIKAHFDNMEDYLLLRARDVCRKYGFVCETNNDLIEIMENNPFIDFEVSHSVFKYFCNSLQWKCFPWEIV